MTALLARGEVPVQPFLIGAISLGVLRDRSRIPRRLTAPTFATVAFDIEVIGSIGRHGLGGSGIGYVAAHIPVSVRLTDEVRLWHWTGEFGRLQ